MASEKYMESLMEVASDYELMSNEMFRLAHKLEDMPRYNPRHEMYSLVRNAEQPQSVCVGWQPEPTGPTQRPYMKLSAMPWASV